MIYIDAEQLQDGLYNIKDGKIYKYKAKGGTVRAYKLENRPQGKWIKDEDGTYRCSNCGGCEEQFIYGTENWYGRGESKFCPSCGARMLKGADDDSDNI